MFNGYRYVYPLFINNEFVGSFEIGINLNAFKNKLSRLNQSVYEYFLEKSYIELFSNVKKKNNFQKTAISNKFCVNREFNKENLEHIEHVNQEIAQNKFYKDKFENKEKFAYWDNSRKYLVVFVPISNVLGEKIAYISRYTIDSFYLDNEANFFSYKAFIFILNSVFFILIIFSIYERNLLDDIINFQKGIVIIANGREIRKVNRAFLDFFGYSNLSKFKKNYNCIYNLFLEIENYLVEDMNGKNWLDYIRDNNEKEHYAILHDREIDGESIFLVDLSENREFSDYSVVSFTDITRLELKRKSLEFDALTGIYNRHKFNELLEYNCDYSSRYNSPLSFVMFDIDHFKQVNDVHGHQMGDKVLQNIAKLVKETIRSVDIFSRWGGEEFIIIMPHTTVKNATKVAENLRKKIEITEIVENIKITSSFGVTERNDFDTEHKLLERVDKALYLAKENGRNQVKFI